jgi:hypothetical protein
MGRIWYVTEQLAHNVPGGFMRRVGADSTVQTKGVRSVKNGSMVFS